MGETRNFREKEIVAHDVRDERAERLLRVGNGSEISVADERREGKTESVADTNERDEYRWRSTMQMGWGGSAEEIAEDGYTGRIEWSIEPDVGRMAHGVPKRVDRLRGLGNAIVPQVAYIFLEAIAREIKICG
jgi:hypothetical protein